MRPGSINLKIDGEYGEDVRSRVSADLADADFWARFHPVTIWNLIGAGAPTPTGMRHLASRATAGGPSKKCQ